MQAVGADNFYCGYAALNFESDTRSTPFWSSVDLRKANKIQNNDARMKINKPYTRSVKIWYAGAPSQSFGMLTPSSTAAVGATSTSRT